MAARGGSWWSFASRFSGDGADPAELVVANAEVFTSDRSRPRATALAVREGRLIYVGDDAGAAVHVGPDRRVIDAGGRTVTLDFVDNHFHVVWIGGMMAMMPNRLMEAKDLEEMLQMVSEQSAAHPELPYVSGVG